MRIVRIKFVVLACLVLCLACADSIIDFDKSRKNFGGSSFQAMQSYRSAIDSDTNISDGQEFESSKDSKNQSVDSKNQKIAKNTKSYHPPTALTSLTSDDFFAHYIKNRPKGIVRDFYIWQYLSEYKLDKKEIHEATKMLNAKNPYMRKVLNNLDKTQTLYLGSECAKMNIKTALKHNDACLSTALKYNMAAFKSMNKSYVDAVLKRIKHSHKDTARAIEILHSSSRTSTLFKENAVVFGLVYHALNSTEKNKLHTENPAKYLKRLSEYKSNGFYNILNAAILDSDLKNLKELLLETDIIDAPHTTLFFLGLNEVRFGSKAKATNYFERVKKATSQAFYIDRATFWQYLVSKDSKYLESLLKSKNANIFTIYASQKLGREPGYKIITRLPSLALQNPPFDIRDPYVWQDIASTMINSADPIKLAKAVPYFSYQDTMPQLAYLMQKIDKYATNYYILPYEGLVKWSSSDEQSFVFAIAKQESHFIPTLISRSFALGIMQIMPANVKPFAKEMGWSDIGYNDLFDPKTSLEMGRHFIKVLQKEYKNPLFVAYAYNGGPGFLRRLLAKKELFLKGREYEPWLSMELIPRQETRLYGMLVIANYVVYQKLFGKDVDVESMLKKTLIYHNDNILR